MTKKLKIFIPLFEKKSMNEKTRLSQFFMFENSFTNLRKSREFIIIVCVFVWGWKRVDRPDIQMPATPPMSSSIAWPTFVSYSHEVLRRKKAKYEIFWIHTHKKLLVYYTFEFPELGEKFKFYKLWTFLFTWEWEKNFEFPTSFRILKIWQLLIFLHL